MHGLRSAMEQCDRVVRVPVPPLPRSQKSCGALSFTSHSLISVKAHSRVPFRWALVFSRQSVLWSKGVTLPPSIEGSAMVWASKWYPACDG